MEKVLKFTNFTYRLAVVFARPLTAEEKVFVEQCAGYSCTKNVSREGARYEWLNDFVIEIDMDSTKRPGHTDLFLGDFYEYLDDGAPKRTTKNNTRLFERVASIDAECVLDVVGDDEPDNIYDELIKMWIGPYSITETAYTETVVTAPKTFTVEIPEGCTSVTVTYNFS